MGAHFVRRLRPPHTSDHYETYMESQQHHAGHSCRFSSKSAISNYHIFFGKRELVLSPYKAAAIWQHFD